MICANEQPNKTLIKYLCSLKAFIWAVKLAEVLHCQQTFHPSGSCSYVNKYRFSIVHLSEHLNTTLANHVAQKDRHQDGLHQLDRVLASTPQNCFTNITLPTKHLTQTHHVSCQDVLLQHICQVVAIPSAIVILL